MTPSRPRQYFADNLRAVSQVGTADWNESALFNTTRSKPQGTGADAAKKPAPRQDVCEVPAHAIFLHFFGSPDIPL